MHSRGFHIFVPIGVWLSRYNPALLETVANMEPLEMAAAVAGHYDVPTMAHYDDYAAIQRIMIAIEKGALLPIKTAPQDGSEIIVFGGELWDETGSPTFGGAYLVYWQAADQSNIHFAEPGQAGFWRIKAGFGELAVCHNPTHWSPVPVA